MDESPEKGAIGPKNTVGLGPERIKTRIGTVDLDFAFLDIICRKERTALRQIINFNL